MTSRARSASGNSSKTRSSDFAKRLFLYLGAARLDTAHVAALYSRNTGERSETGFNPKVNVTNAGSTADVLAEVIVICGTFVTVSVSIMK